MGHAQPPAFGRIEPREIVIAMLLLAASLCCCGCGGWSAAT